jgi:poly(3-hydroxyalkanoate) depolymerase
VTGPATDAYRPAPVPTTGIDHVRVCHQDIRVHIRPGSGAGVPLLMCGGIGASLEVLGPLVNAVDPAIEIIRFDVPGIGGSPGSLLPYSFPQLALVVGRLLDELGYPQVDVLGYSWGGALAQQLAWGGADRYRRLVLISTSTGLFAVPGDPRVMKEMLTPRNFRNAREAMVMAARLQHPAETGLASVLPTGLSDLVAAGSSLGYLHQLLAIGTWSSLPLLPFIGQPVLVISGDADPIVPLVNARIMTGLLPRSTLHVFSGDHLGIVTAATELGERTGRFLTA